MMTTNETRQIVHRDHFAVGSGGVDIFQIDIIDDIGLRRIEGAGKSAHKSAQQARQHKPHETYR